MKKIALYISLILIANVGYCQNENAMDKTIYQFKVKDILGKTFDFEQLRGKKIMIVNTASRCGMTGQYKGLQKLYERYKDSGFTIIGFPANDFLWQEPGSDKEIAAFCKKNYGAVSYTHLTLPTNREV